MAFYSITFSAFSSQKKECGVRDLNDCKAWAEFVTVFEMNHDLILFGAGHLGTKIGRLWQKQFTGCKVFAVTRTATRHEEFKNLGFNPVIAGAALPHASDMVIAIPPSPDYLTHVASALKQTNGRTVLISSSGVYTENANGVVTEKSAVDSESIQVKAENLVLARNGLVLRLAGLYDQKRGPHVHYLKTLAAKSSAESYLNLIHTDDAAEMAMRCLRNGMPSSCYLGCDNHPIVRSDFVHLILGEERAHNFQYSDVGANGKRCDGAWTQNALSWQPKWHSFSEWWISNMKKNSY